MRDGLYARAIADPVMECDRVYRQYTSIYIIGNALHSITSGVEDSINLSPYSEDELLQRLLHGSINVMQMIDSPHPPSFSITHTQEFLSEQPQNSPTAHTLPPNFIISLLYKPLNNTVLSLFSVLTYPKPSPNQNRGSDNQNSSNTNLTRATFQSELILSHSATLVQPDQYYDLWQNFSDTTLSKYAMNLIVMNGQVGMCLSGDYYPPMQDLKLWSDVKTTEALELRFSPYLKSVSSLVIYNNIAVSHIHIYMHGCFTFLHTVFQGIICSMKIIPLPDDLPSSPFLCSLVFHACFVSIR